MSETIRPMPMKLGGGLPAAPHRTWSAWLECLRLEAEAAWASGEKKQGIDLYCDMLGVLRREARTRAWPLLGNDEQSALYVAIRLDGGTETLAEMLAMQQPPMSNTDREFLQGTENGRQFQDNTFIGDFYKNAAREAGQDPTGKIYLSGLARYPGDPEAWVSGRGDVQRVCEQRGWGCEGSVNMPVRKVAELSGGGIAPDIVERRVSEILETTPDAARVDVQDLREQVAEKIKPHWAA